MCTNQTCRHPGTFVCLRAVLNETLLSTTRTDTPLCGPWAFLLRLHRTISHDYQVRSECLTCIFRASCCSARLSRHSLVRLSGTGKKRRERVSFYCLVKLLHSDICHLLISRVGVNIATYILCESDGCHCKLLVSR